MSTFVNSCRFNATSGGSGPFVVASAVPTYKTPEQALATDDKVYFYYAENADASQFEQGSGAYDYTTHSLARTIIDRNSDGTTIALAFTTSPQVDVFPSPPPNLELAPSLLEAGTTMLFQQSAAPLYWTKQTTHHDKVLRVVSGAASFGGDNPFSGTFYYRTSDATTLSIAQMPSHNHSEIYTWIRSFGSASAAFGVGSDYELYVVPASTGFQGGSGPHNHTFDMRVQYVDLIIARKD